jgi:DNA-directed RNA polymerase specialized sigma24 family protein
MTRGKKIWSYLPGRDEDDPLFRYLDAEMRERLTKAIEELPKRERMVMTHEESRQDGDHPKTTPPRIS